MEEEIRVDTAALKAEIIRNAEKDGFTIKGYCPFITSEDFFKQKEVIPLVEVAGYVNPMTIAFMINALETTIEQLKAKDGVKELLAFVKLFSDHKELSIKGDGKEKTNDSDSDT